jgi:hypothetical protein
MAKITFTDAEVLDRFMSMVEGMKETKGDDDEPEAVADLRDLLVLLYDMDVLPNAEIALNVPEKLREIAQDVMKACVADWQQRLLSGEIVGRYVPFPPDSVTIE